jgi:hypothetical protein
MTVCAFVMGKYIPELKFLQVLLGDEPVLRPHERLYQRLLASSRDEADSVLQAALRQTSILEVCDAIIVPAILRTKEDHDRGTLSDARRQTILDHVNAWVDERLDTLAPVRPRFAGGVAGIGVPEVADPTNAVLCIPASDRADEIIAKLLEVVLIERGMSVRLIGPRDAINHAVQDHKAPAIVVSALPPDAVAAARSVCKRMRIGDATTPLLVGLWMADGDIDRARQRLGAAGATRTVLTFADCLEQLETALAGAALEPDRQPDGLGDPESEPELVPPAGSAATGA